MSNLITFYDIPSTAPGNAWSPNTCKTRYSLNFKGIPYKTEWVEYPDIEAVCRKLGIVTAYKKEDGTPLYTLPAIYDPSTGTALADSILIAEYLDEKYPETPKLFPPGTRSLQQAALQAFASTLDPLWQFVLPATNGILNPRSEEYFRRTRESQYGKKLEDIPPVGKKKDEECAKVKAAFETVDGWLQKGKGPGESYFMGSTVCFTDLVIASYILWVRKIFGEASPEWQEVTAWSDGRWAKFMKGLEKYEKVV
ncbi:hypothetical protein BDZ94DRAFT_1257437 [Collybia nuda]|uniref:GST N-terminal domain-containing protein n=1 Tax=Collybia nuda TaxID=64659 RepID=A0A9P5Y8C3_9AGAR|nr:hypothetical protein BDZ94DRAFT_1257437 [Collybia nuda]